MMTRAACLLIAFVGVVALAIAILCPIAVDAAESGRIDGVVVNGTAGFDTPEGLPVTTHVFRDRTKVGERLAMTGPGGRFSLDGLETGAEFVYLPIVEYGGVSYFPERPIALEKVVEQSVEIRVFEPTGSDSSIAYERLNMLVLGFDAAAISIMEMGALVNQSDRTVVANRVGDGIGQTARFQLPAGASQITPQAGFSVGSIVATPQGFASGDPIRPGRHEFAFSYQLPITSPRLDVSRRFAYPVGQFNLYAPATGVDVVSPALTFQGTAELGGQRFRVYGASSIDASADLPALFSGLPARLSIGPTQLGIAVTGLALTVLATSLFILARRRSEPPTSAGEARAVLDTRQRAMAQAIADLDDRFERGEVDPARYRLERDRAKGELVDSLTRSGG
jgi:hypothetical protein